MTGSSSAPSWPAPDPFSYEMIEGRPDPVVVDLLARVRGQEPWAPLRARAKTIPRGLTPMQSQASPKSDTSNVVLIDRQPADAGGSAPDGSDAPVAPAQYRPATPERAAALRLLRSVPEPLTIVRVARALMWSESRAKGWLYEFQAKGVLVKCGREYRWRTT